MPKFGSLSLINLAECHPDLQRLFEAVVTQWDCQVIDGARTVREQEKNVARGVSKTMDSKHLPQEDGKSHAADVMPYPFDWAKIERGLNAVKAIDSDLSVMRVYAFIGYVAGVADQLGIPLRQGADWDSDHQFGDHTFIDLPHHELSD